MLQPKVIPCNELAPISVQDDDYEKIKPDKIVADCGKPAIAGRLCGL